MNRKGFMMVELVVVSSVILLVLVGLYTSYNKIYSTYKTRISYSDVTVLYRIGYYRDILKENRILLREINKAKNDNYVLIYNTDNTNNIVSNVMDDGYKEIVYLFWNNKNKLNTSVFDNRNVTFKNYINYFNNSVNYTKFDCVMVMERCKATDIDNCTYGYLEILDFPSE